MSTGLGYGSTRLGNKGGIGISLSVGRTKILFVNAHLAHGQKGLAKRNEEFHVITSQLARAFVPRPQNERPWESDAVAIRALMEHYDGVFWAGDLNYRVALDRPTVDALLLRRADIEEILQHDQLKSVMKNGDAFQGLAEPSIAFNPTYKVLAFNSTRNPPLLETLLMKFT